MVEAQKEFEESIEEVEEIKDLVENQPTLKQYFEDIAEETAERIKALPSLPDDYPLLRKYVELYYDIQKSRIQMENRITSYLWLQAATRGEIQPGDKRARGKFAKMTKLYLKGKEEPPEDIEYFVVTRNHLYELERVLGIKLGEFAYTHEFFTEYLQHIKGIGPILGTGIIAFGPYSRFPTISKMWKYMGTAPGQGPGNPDKKYNRKMKVTFYKSAMQFVKLGVRSPYGRLYKKWRAEYDQKRPEWKPFRRYWASLRKVAKLLAAHVWLVWWSLMEGQDPPTKPYPFAHQQGHADYYDPWEFTAKRI